MDPLFPISHCIYGQSFPKEAEFISLLPILQKSVMLSTRKHSIGRGFDGKYKKVLCIPKNREQHRKRKAITEVLT